jgi:hypothetical protein
LLQGLQHVTGTRDVRQINLGFDLVAVTHRGTPRVRGLLRFTMAAEMCPHLFGFVLFNRTGMGFLLGDADNGEYVQDRFALDFQFPG